MKNRINQDYIYTEEWADVTNVKLSDSSLYIHAHDPESRSGYCAPKLEANNKNTQFIEVKRTDDDEMEIMSNGEKYPLNSEKSVTAFFNKYGCNNIYMEVTGLSCRLVAPLMKHAMKHDVNMFVVYAEPASYKLSEFRKMGVNKDLSERVDGISPLPGMISLMPDDTPKLFVAMLGFEGGRFSALIQDYNPVTKNITPIIGVPGYRWDYPYITYWGNQFQMSKTDCWQNARYAEANSVVDSYMLLKQISYDHPDQQMVVAPIGTKPHAIGAILYALKNPRTVELLYDNPKRSIHRTEGIGKVLSCNITKLYKEN